MEIINCKPYNPFFGTDLINSLLNTGFAVIQTKDYFSPEIYKITDKIFKIPQGQLDGMTKDGTLECFRYGSENAKGQSKPDLKEFIHLKEPIIYTSFPGLSATENWILSDTKYRLWKISSVVFEKVLEYIDYKFDIKESVGFYNKTNKNSILRLLHYPALQNVDVGSVRAAAHEDINLITALLGTHEPGLQALKNGTKNEWIDIPTGDHNTVVVNVGDMLQSITNGMFKSTTHRVLNADISKPRFSLPYFYHADPEANIGPIKEIVDVMGVRNYPDRTSQDYLEERLREIGLKK